MFKSIKILFIGNSFSEDTTAYVAEISREMGFSEVVVANLYIGGCPIEKHYHNMLNNLPTYRYSRNDGSGWTQTPNFKISDAIQEEVWDWICIQHGSSYGGRYTDEESYKELQNLVKEVKQLAGNKTKIAFNMTWVGEPSCDRPEMLEFGRNQNRYFEAICDITQRIVIPLCDIDLVCPTGTAVQNARTTILNNRLNRDGYHLSLDVGRYLAALTFMHALTDISIDKVLWKPPGITEQDKTLILKAVNKAIERPYCISTIL